MPNKIPFTQCELKKILSLFAYNFKNGPWKFAYVKFGFDPTQYFEAINYQVIDIAVHEKDIPLNSAIYNHEFQLYDPTYTEKPSNYRHLYQICDIQDQNVRKFFIKCKEKLDLKDDKIVNEKSGWLEMLMLRRIQKIMKDKFRLETQN